MQYLAIPPVLEGGSTIPQTVCMDRGTGNDTHLPETATGLKKNVIARITVYTWMAEHYLC